MRFYRTSPSGRKCRGFSLIELLTVIAIVSVLMTVVAIGIGSIGGKGVANAVASAEAMFEEARAIALSKRTTTRVLVNLRQESDLRHAQSRETHLRRMIIAYQELDEEGRPTENWTVASRGILLPEGTYFSQEFSRRDHKAGDVAPDRVSLGSSVKADFRGDYYSYEFNAEGICTTPGASFVVGAGTLPYGQDRPRATGGAKRDFGGFVIWRNGTTSSFRSPDQIGIPTNPTTF